MRAHNGLGFALVAGGVVLLVIAAVVLVITGVCVALTDAPAWIRIGLLVMLAWFGVAAFIRADCGRDWDRRNSGA